MTSTKPVEQPELTQQEMYAHALHQMPELRLRVGETRNEHGGRVWADTGEPSVSIKPGCRLCEKAYNKEPE